MANLYAKRNYVKPVNRTAENVYLAYERTLLAWIRTAVSLITFGFTLYKLFENNQGAGFFNSRVVGMAMIAVGNISMLLAALQYRKKIKYLKKQYSDSGLSYSLLVACLIALLGITAFLTAVFRQ